MRRGRVEGEGGSVISTFFVRRWIRQRWWNLAAEHGGREFGEEKVGENEIWNKINRK